MHIIKISQITLTLMTICFANNSNASTKLYKRQPQQQNQNKYDYTQIDLETLTQISKLARAVRLHQLLLETNHPDSEFFKNEYEKIDNETRTLTETMAKKAKNFEISLIYKIIKRQEGEREGKTFTSALIKAGLSIVKEQKIKKHKKRKWKRLKNISSQKYDNTLIEHARRTFFRDRPY